MRSFVASIVLLAASVAAPAFADPVDDVAPLLREGRFDAAATVLEGASTRDVAARTELGALYRELGRYEEALAVLEAVRGARGAPPRATIELARVFLETGRPSEAADILDPLVEGEGEPDREARYWRAIAFMQLGRESRARLDLEDFIREYNRGQARDPAGLRLVGMACRELELFQDSNSAFREALDLDAMSVDIRIEWARLFIDKYRPDEARTLLLEARDAAPAHPVVNALLGRAVLDELYDIPAARDYAEQALAVSPGQADALLLLAEMAIDDQKYSEALAFLDRVAAGDADPRVASLRGAVYYLLDDTTTFATLETQALRNPRLAARFYHTVGEAAIRSFRYVEGLELFEKAVYEDAGYSPAYVSLGIGYSRIGDDQRALTFLQRAFEHDPFNQQAYYMVELWERTLGDYEYVDDPAISGLRYRFHQSERAVLERYIPDVISDTYAEYVRRYGESPEMPVSIEVFPDPETFSIRSVGLPWASQHGICFGHVVTSRSPSDGNFNWQNVIQHELSHVFHLNVSRWRVPRWFTEGMAEYDTIRTRDQWRREEELALVRQIQAGRLPGIERMNAAFVDVDSLDQVLAAYFQASLMVEFIAIRWSYDSLVEMLRGWSRSLPTADVVSTVLGVSVDEFDAAFDAWLRERLAPLLSLYEPTWYDFADLEAISATAEAAPTSAPAQSALAAALYYAGDPAGAGGAARAAFGLDPTDPLALFVLATLSTDSLDWAGAERGFNALLGTGRQSVTALYGLGLALAMQQRHAEASVALEQAVAIFPRMTQAWALLSEVYTATTDVARSEQALRAVADLEQNDPEAPRRLARLYLDRGDATEAWHYAEMLVAIAPFEVETHRLAGEAAAAAQQWEAARRELELELAAGAVDRARTLTLLVETYTALGLSDLAERTRRQIPQ